jgi:hypothetical protein
VILDVMPQTESPADRDVQKDQIGFERTPDYDSSVGGYHGSINEPDATTTKQSQAKVSVLHYGKCLIATSDGKKIGTAKEHDLITEQETAAPNEDVRSKDQRSIPSLDPIMKCRAPPDSLWTRDQ